MAYQSLYRRYRPQRFGEVQGQDHVVAALRNAVRTDTVGHAYLFSGPRGTGKTSTARILAKALNCTALEDGEPCGSCESCVAIAEGSSLDVNELDAASHGGIDPVRDLVARASLGMPGRRKVYIVDEAHMLTAGGSNALLKTLEEPPSHVVFVLATTDPKKMLPTIRSRTQHFEFNLAPVDLLERHLGEVAAEAGIDVSADVVAQVARKGAGSFRDALSVLEQVAAGGSVGGTGVEAAGLADALSHRDTAAVLTAVAAACESGLEPRNLATELVDHLRRAFLAAQAPALAGLPDADLPSALALHERLGTAGTVRAMEVLGAALVDMREALDPRVTLEVALVRLTRPEGDASPEALLDRIERLERQIGAGGPPAALLERIERLEQGGASGGRTTPGAPPPIPPRPAAAASEPPAATPVAADAAPSDPEPVAQTPPPSAATGTLPSRDELTLAFEHVLVAVPRSRGRFVGHFVETAGDAAVYALDNDIYRRKCEELRPQMEEALAAHFGRPVPLRLVVEASAPTEATPTLSSALVDDDDVDLTGLEDAPPVASDPVEHVRAAFPGAEVVE